MVGPQGKFATLKTGSASTMPFIAPEEILHGILVSRLNMGGDEWNNKR